MAGRAEALGEVLLAKLFAGPQTAAENVLLDRSGDLLRRRIRLVLGRRTQGWETVTSAICDNQLVRL